MIDNPNVIKVDRPKAINLKADTNTYKSLLFEKGTMKSKTR
jgi:hypothetical protein